jgi:hypothetical protein
MKKTRIVRKTGKSKNRKIRKNRKTKKTKKYRGGNSYDSITRVENQPYSYDIIIEEYRDNVLLEKINGLYTGPWKYNQPYMRGKMDIFENNNTTIKATYDGPWMNGKPDGKDCKYTTAIGNTYVGEYKDGVMDGRGIFNYANGIKYDGEFKNGFMDGNGTVTYTNGSKYVGEIKRNVKSGYGVLTYSNGTRYEGQWANNYKNGIGTLYSTNKVYTGQWLNGNPNGNGNISFTKTGVILNGYFLYDQQNDIITVKGIANYKDNSKYEGLFINYIKSGNGITTPPGDNLANNSNYDIQYGFELRDPTNITVDSEFFE